MGNIHKTIVKNLRISNFNSQHELQLGGKGKKVTTNFEK